MHSWRAGTVRVPQTAWACGRLAGRSPRPLSRLRAADRLGARAARPRTAMRPITRARASCPQPARTWNAG